MDLFLSYKKSVLQTTCIVFFIFVRDNKDTSIDIDKDFKEEEIENKYDIVFSNIGKFKMSLKLYL